MLAADSRQTGGNVGLRDVGNTHCMERTEIRAEQIEPGHPQRVGAQHVAAAGEKGLGDAVQRTRGAQPFGGTFALRIMAERRTRQDAPRRLARLRQRHLAGSAERRTARPSIGAILRHIAAQQFAIATATDTQTKTFKFGVPIKFFGPICRELARDGLGIQFQLHGALLWGSTGEAARERALLRTAWMQSRQVARSAR